MKPLIINAFLRPEKTNDQLKEDANQLDIVKGCFCHIKILIDSFNDH